MSEYCFSYCSVVNYVRLLVRISQMIDSYDISSIYTYSYLPSTIWHAIVEV